MTQDISNKKLTVLNIVFAVLLQILTLASGFIIPKIVLSYFGSEVNGMISSISQFLNYVQLLEGGLSGVATAALYKALAAGDEKKVSSIIKAIDVFFKKIALIYVCYAIVVSVVYPLVVKSDFDFVYVFSLVLIIAAGLFVQYFFSLTYKLLITSDRRGYVVSIAQIIFTVLNAALVIASVKIYPSIHILKAAGVAAYIVQPVIFGLYVKKNYSVDKNAERDEESIKQRWDGFGQNIAYFIHSNTDVVLLTLFAGLGTVSVYSVYMMIINAVQALLISVSGAIKPIFGNVLAGKSIEEANEVFDYYELGMNILTAIAYSCCAVLIVDFVKIYTRGVSDADYVKPLFAVLMCAAEAVYCFRDPFVSAAYAAGRFKETAKYAYAEALANIVISLILVRKFGLAGVAAGTLSAMVYRMIAHVIYAKKHILYRPVRKWLKGFLVSLLSGAAGAAIVFKFVRTEVNGYLQWFVFALISFLIILATVLTATAIFYRKNVKRFLKEIIPKK